MRKRNGFLCLLAVCLLVTAAMGWPPAGASGTASNWPQWRGPESSGVSPEKDLPIEWDATKNVQWRTSIPGRGHSSPIVWGKQIFLTTSVEGPVVPGATAPVHLIQGKAWKHPDSVGADRHHTLKVLSLHRDTGKVLWERTAYEGTIYDDRHRKNTYATPTPVTDGRYVFAYFGSEGLYAYDFVGKLIWKVALGQLPTMGMGVGTSPVLYENLVIVQCDREEGENSFIVALDKKTGKEVWRMARKVQVSWSTPIVARTAQRAELVTSGNEFVIAYDPATGAELWRTRGVDSNAIPSPVAGHGLVYISAGFPAKRVMAIRLGGSADLTDTPDVVWKYDKGTAYVPSPLLYGDYLYLVTDKGILTCLDARTGEVKYQGGRVPVPATFTASLLAFDGKIFQFSEDGDTFVIKAGPAHEVLRTNSLDEPIYSTPAVSAGKIFIRGEKYLYCIGSRAGKPATKKS